MLGGVAAASLAGRNGNASADGGLNGGGGQAESFVLQDVAASGESESRAEEETAMMSRKSSAKWGGLRKRLSSARTSKTKDKSAAAASAEDRDACLIAPSWFMTKEQVLQTIEDRGTYPELASSEKPSSPQGHKVSPNFSFKRSKSMERFESKDVKERFARYTKAAARVQSVWRGHVDRNNFKKRLHLENDVRHESVVVFSQLCKTLIVGFDRLFLHLVYLTVVIVFVELTTIEADPPARSIYQMLDLEFQAALDGTNVLHLDDLYDVMEKLVVGFYHADQEYLSALSQECKAKLANCSGPVPLECLEVTSKSGFIDQFNRIVFGLMVSQNRFTKVPCDSEFSMYPPQVSDLECHGDAATDYFPIPTHVPPLADGSAPTKISDYNALETAFTYDPHQFDLGFHTFANLGVFNAPLETALCNVRLLERVGWIDDHTSTVCFTLFVENQEGEALWGVARLCYSIDKGGRVDRDLNIQSSNIYILDEQGAALFFLAAYFLFTVGFLVPACRKLVKTGFRSPVGVYIDLFTLLLHFAAIALYVVILATSTRLVEKNNLFITEVALDKLPLVFETLDTFGVLLTEIDTFEKLLALVLITMAIRTLIMLDFHPQLGFISNTMGHALSELSLFLLVFSLLVVFYAIIGNLLLGNDADGFRTVGSAISSLIFTAVGELGFVYDVVATFDGYPTLTRILVSFYFWTFIVLTALLLLNVLLSIIIDSFMRSKEIMSSHAALQFSALESVGFWLQWRTFDVKNYVIPRICTCCGRKPERAKIPYHSFIISDSNDAEIKFQQPITYDQVMKLLVACSDWRTPCFVYRYELSQVFSQKFSDKLVAMLRNHGTHMNK